MPHQGKLNIVFESSLEDFHFSTNTPLDSAISAARGNYGDAAVNAAAAIPGIGLGVGAGKLTRGASNILPGLDRTGKIHGKLQEEVL